MKTTLRTVLAPLIVVLAFGTIIFAGGMAQAQTANRAGVQTLPTLPSTVALPNVALQPLPATTTLPVLVNRPPGQAYCQVNVPLSEVFIQNDTNIQVRQTTCLLQAQSGVMDPRCAGTIIQTDPAANTRAVTTAQKYCCRLLKDPARPCGNAPYCTVTVTDQNAPPELRGPFTVRSTDAICR